jgi:hypothetical protein
MPRIERPSLEAVVIRSNGQNLHLYPAGIGGWTAAIDPPRRSPINVDQRPVIPSASTIPKGAARERRSVAVIDRIEPKPIVQGPDDESFVAVVNTDRETPITAADLLNDRVVPVYDAHEVKLCRVLTDRGTEYCGEHHEYELYPAVEDVDHSRTKTKSPHFLAGSELFSSRAWVTARRRAGREAQALPRSLHRRTSVVRTRLGPRGFQPETKRA